MPSNPYEAPSAVLTDDSSPPCHRPSTWKIFLVGTVKCPSCGGTVAIKSSVRALSLTFGLMMFLGAFWASASLNSGWPFLIWAAVALAISARISKVGPVIHRNPFIERVRYAAHASILVVLIVIFLTLWFRY